MRADDELLAAYCDGITELSLDERKRVEALLAASDTARADEAATRSVLSRLRELPAETDGNEPDWLAMERSIRAAVGPVAPSSWWRPMWRWLVPLTTLAAAATIAIIAIGPRDSSPTPQTVAMIDAGMHAPAMPASSDDVALWLDGHELIVDDLDDELLDEVDDVLLGEGDLGVDGLLSGDLAWIDELDDDGAAIAEQWLDERTRS